MAGSGYVRAEVDLCQQMVTCMGRTEEYHQPDLQTGVTAYLSIDKPHRVRVEIARPSESAPHLTPVFDGEDNCYLK